MTVDLAGFKARLQASVIANADLMHAKWVSLLNTADDPDDLRKYLEFAAKLTGAIADPAKDPHAGLPTFQFHIGVAPGASVTVQGGAGKPLETVEEVQPAQAVSGALPLPELDPALVMPPLPTAQEVQVQVSAAEDLMGELDALLRSPDDAGHEERP